MRYVINRVQCVGTAWETLEICMRPPITWLEKTGGKTQIVEAQPDLLASGHIERLYDSAAGVRANVEGALDLLVRESLVEIPYVETVWETLDTRVRSTYMVGYTDRGSPARPFRLPTREKATLRLTFTADVTYVTYLNKVTST